MYVKMRAPNFWKNINSISILLLPFSIVYCILVFFNKKISKQYKSKLKIICVGNINVGGDGKTPIAIEIGKILKENNINFAYLSKGYSSGIKEFTKVEKNESKFGDEPLLLAEIADTFICYNRKTAIKNLENYNYDVIVMDDGFQNPTIFKDKNIVVINGNYGFGNGFLLPAGPCRETISNAFKRASFFIMIGNDKQNIGKYLKDSNFECLNANINISNTLDKTQTYIAFCGIGKPIKFFNTLEENNFNIIKKYEFEDHHKYKDSEIKNMLMIANKSGAKLITTKKDWIKFSNNNFKKEIAYLDIQIIFNDTNRFRQLLLK